MKKVSSWLPIILAVIPLLSSATLIPSIGIKTVAYRGIAFISISLIAYAFIDRKTRDMLTSRFIKITHTPLFISMTLSIVLLACSTMFAFDKHVAFFGEVERGEGFLTLFSLYALYVVMSLTFQQNEWKKFFVSNAVVTLVLFIVQVVEAVKLMHRPSATLGNAMFIAGYYVLSLFAACFLYFDKTLNTRSWGKRLAITSAIVSAGGILISETRGTLIGLVMGLLIASLVMVFSEKHIKVGHIGLRKIGYFFLGIFIVFILLFTTTRSSSFWQEVPGVNRIAGGDTTTLSSRLIFLKVARNGFIQSTTTQKIIGWGWDNYRFFSDKYYDAKIYDFDKSTADRAHNKLADMLIMTGLLGLFAYVAIWVFLFKKIFSLLQVNRLLGIGCLFVSVAYFVHNLFGFDVAVTYILFYAFIALMTQSYYGKTN